MTSRPSKRTISRLLIVLAAVVLVPLSACGSHQGGSPASAGTAAASKSPTLYIGGIPDQDPSVLQRLFGLTAQYLSQQTGLNVQYIPSTDYAAVVSAFQRGDISLAWFGGLTGVQARSTVPGSDALVQRSGDSTFHSVFIVGAGVHATTLADLKGLTFTFGSESSTSGHLMPRYYLLQAGIDPEKDFAGPPGYSGSHSKTWKLVQAGAYQAGALDAQVWHTAVQNGQVDTSKVHVIYTTPPFYDYNWSIRPDVDAKFGAGTAAKIRQAFLNLKASMGPQEAEILKLFATDRFVPTKNSNYDSIATVARKLGIIQ